jgi:hypothetical protein
MTTGATAGLIEDAATGLAKAIKGGGEIVDTQGDAVQTGSALLDEFGDGGIGAGGFEQFDARRVWGRSGRQHGDADALQIYRFGVRDGHAEGLLVEPQAFLEVANGYA